MNYFDPKEVAERYAKGRPPFHSNTVEHIRTYLKIGPPLDSALDIACGTGLSTKALLKIANHVYGTDISQEMLKLAEQTDKINYAVAPAEQQPFADHSFDLITVSSGVHWFDIDRFLQEANRLLKSKAWLVLYENHFIAEMEEQDDFKNWFYEVYLKRFPSPPRNTDYNWGNENLTSKGFLSATEERFKNAVTFTKKQLALYFTTQSNIISAVENNSRSYEEIEDWLHKELTPFFDSDRSTRTIYYGNWIKFIQRAG